MTSSLGLTPEQIETFDREGCLVIPGEFSPEIVSTLLSESNKLLKEFPIENHPMTKFITGGAEGEVGEGHIGDDYFLTSSDKVHFFFEEGAFDPETGDLIKPKERAINKIGHFLHELNPQFKRVSMNERNRAIAESLGFKDPRILQSMVICKQPTIGGEVPPHQDATFLYTDPLSCVGFWYALEDCTKDNGALEYLPGSHKTTPVTKRLVRKSAPSSDPSVLTKTTKTQFEPVLGEDGEPLKLSEQAERDQNDASKYKLIDCPAGSLILINHSVLHKSNFNKKEKSRYAYAFHIIEGQAEYDEKNWLQIPSTGGTNFTKL